MVKDGVVKVLAIILEWLLAALVCLTAEFIT